MSSFRVQASLGWLGTCALAVIGIVGWAMAQDPGSAGIYPVLAIGFGLIAAGTAYPTYKVIRMNSDA